MKSLICCSSSLAAVVMGGFFVAFSFAAAPTTQESDHKGERPRLGRIDGQRPASWRDRASATTKPATADEQREVDAFMTENSPKRWARINDLPEKRRDELKKFVLQRYRMLQDLKQVDSQMYDLRLKRLKIEDEIFDLGWALKNNKDEKFSPEAARKELRVKVRALANSSIDEHRLRLKQWQEKMEQEAKRLNEERATIDQFVDSSVTAIENDMRWPGMREMVMPLPGRNTPPGRELRNMAPATQPDKDK